MLTGNGTRLITSGRWPKRRYTGLNNCSLGTLTLRDYDAQVGEAMAMIRALNKMTRAGMPERVRIAWVGQ
jgi:hypothetical protein